MSSHLAWLPGRGVVEVTGEDRLSFLQGLVSNDVNQVGAGRIVWAALLTPQGRWLADFFIFMEGPRLLLDCERAQVGALVARLMRFRLRAKVACRDVSGDFAAHAAWGDPPTGDHITALDPRLPGAGWRILADRQLSTNATFEDWDRHRLLLGLPDGSRDLEAEKSLLLEAGFDELNGISWSKGCYMGQELTARTKYRGLVKHRLVPVEPVTSVPPPGTPLLDQGVVVGTMRSGLLDHGLAIVRLGSLGRPLDAAGVRLIARPPSWLRLADGRNGSSADPAITST